MKNLENVAHQVAFVSHQTLPTILGALKFKPKCVHLITNKTMEKQTEWLKTYLEKHLFSVKVYHIPSDRNKPLSKVLTQIYEEHKESLALNITGGTKLFTIEATEWLFTCRTAVPSFYVDTKNDELVYPSIDEDWAYEQLPDLLKHDDILEGNGFSIVSSSKQAVAIERRNAAEKLLKIFAHDNGVMNTLNALATKARAGKNYEIKNDKPEYKELTQALEICAEAKLLGLDGEFIVFTSKEAIEWCNGLWFDEYVASTLYKLQQEKTISSWASSVQITKEHTPNEIDVLFTSKNRLFAIECKTTKMEEKNQLVTGNEKSTSYIYKLDSLKEKLGGNLTTSILCSVSELADFDQKRAKRDKVKIITGKDLLNPAFEKAIKKILAES